MALAPGDVVDRYRIVLRLGAGGMGEVYEAQDLRLQRRVALKILITPSSAAGDATRADERTSSPHSEGSARMLREARAVAALEHPNVVAVYDVGEVTDPPSLHGTTFLAMELVRGRPLRAYLGDDSVTLSERVRWLVDVARALGAAHERDLVHRDVKPDNVMLRDDGVIKVLDFGIAKRLDTPVSPTTSTEAHVLPALTRDGVAIGTPYYMAPEQMRGEVLDGRADQFSWGVMAYELLCGRPPWTINAPGIQLVAEVLSHDPPTPASLNAAIPTSIDAAVRRALCKRREDRFATMADLVAALTASPVAYAATEPRILLEHAEGGTLKSPVAEPLPTTPSPPPPPPSSPPTSLIGVSAGFVTPPPVTPAPSAPHRETSTAPAVPSTPRASTPRRSRRTIALGALVVLASVVALTMVARRPRSSSEGSSAATASSAAPANECTTSVECVRRNAGRPSRCRPDTGRCVLLESEDCRVRARAGDVESDETVWFGTMFPRTGVDAAVYGIKSELTVDLARDDFAQALEGFSSSAHVRRIGVVACDDARDPTRAARHLVDAVGAPAVIGFRGSKEATDLAASLFLPRGVMTVAALNTSPLIASLPQPHGAPRLVWRTTYNMAKTALPIARLVSEVIEPRAVKAGGGATRVALVRSNNAAHRAFGEALFTALRYNGKSALENGDDFRLFAMDEASPDWKSLLDDLLGFRPTVIVYVVAEAVVAQVFEPLERRWPAGVARPHYVQPSVFWPALFQFIGADASRRQRHFGLTTVSTTATNARFVMHYNESHADKISRTASTSESYDAFYLLAYATLALGDAPVSGGALAAAIARLVPPGKRIEVGPSDIFDAYTALRDQGRIDLVGATGDLDFDLSTGEAPVDQAILCVDVDARGRATDSVESGLIFRAAKNELEGTLRCR